MTRPVPWLCQLHGKEDVVNLSARIIAAAVMAASLAGCSTWDKMSRTEKDTAIGAGVGAVVGGAATDSAVGTLGGAAVGGVIGHEVGKRREAEGKR